MINSETLVDQNVRKVLEKGEAAPVSRLEREPSRIGGDDEDARDARIFEGVANRRVVDEPTVVAIDVLASEAERDREVGNGERGRRGHRREQRR